jgi:omega-hydroxy-beta-dihydromenaquinone-9 sulfotransferase
MRAWVEAGERTAPLPWQQRARLRWGSFWFERNLRLQRRLFPPLPLAADPLFVMGLWRTGTTLAHELLAACPTLRAPATWECMNPSAFRLQRGPVGGAVRARPMDGMAITALSAQEDEFALLSLGVPSVYRGFVDPRRLGSLAQWLEPGAWAINAPEGWVERWREFLAWVARDHRGPLVLKSPNHTFRIQAIEAAFPAAHHLWLVRDPLETFHSNRKMWRAMFEQYAAWPWDAEALDVFLLSAFDAAGRALEYAAAALPPHRLCVIDFADFTELPVSTLTAALRRLELPSSHAEAQALFAAAEPLRKYQRTAYVGAAPLPANAAATLKRLHAQQRMALASHGIKLPA